MKYRIPITFLITRVNEPRWNFNSHNLITIFFHRDRNHCFQKQEVPKNAELDTDSTSKVAGASPAGNHDNCNHVKCNHDNRIYKS